MNVTPPNEASLFVVSGGGKGITAQCVIELAQRYPCEFVLLGRSSIAEPEPGWATGHSNEATLKKHAIQALRAAGSRPKPAAVQREVRRILSRREINGTLREIETAGGKATYLSVDVTNAAALHSALAPWHARVTGIIHGAGVLADKLIAKKTAADFDKVYGVKVNGLKNLLDCVPPSQLHYLVLFSSVAGVYGNVGQADYALANEVLNKLAHRIQHDYPACHVVAMDWGPWDGGMVTPELKLLFAERHIPVIPVAVGTDILADELARADASAQVVVGSALTPPAYELSANLQNHRIHRQLTLAANPFLRDHVIGGHAVLPTVCAVGWMINACEQLYSGYVFSQVEDYRVFKGIIFDDTLADDYILDVTEIAKSQDELVFNTLIWSTMPNGKPRYHYQAQVTLRQEAKSKRQEAKFQQSTTHNPQSMAAISGTTLYSDKILFHGPSFQGIDEVLSLTPQGLTMRCLLPNVPTAVQGQFPVQTFNPYLTDVQLQSLLVWAKQMHGVVGLPLRIQKGEQFRQARFDEVLYVTLNVQSASNHNLVADVLVHDAAGNLYSRVTGAEITLSNRLNVLFEQNQI